MSNATPKTTTPAATNDQQSLAVVQRELSALQKLLRQSPEAFKAQRRAEIKAELEIAQTELRAAVKLELQTAAKDASDAKLPELEAEVRRLTQRHLDLLSCGSEWEHRKLSERLEFLESFAHELRRKVNAPKTKRKGGRR